MEVFTDYKKGSEKDKEMVNQKTGYQAWIPHSCLIYCCLQGHFKLWWRQLDVDLSIFDWK